MYPRKVLFHFPSVDRKYDVITLQPIAHLLLILFRSYLLKVHNKRAANYGFEGKFYFYVTTTVARLEGLQKPAKLNMSRCRDLAVMVGGKPLLLRRQQEF